MMPDAGAKLPNVAGNRVAEITVNVEDIVRRLNELNSERMLARKHMRRDRVTDFEMVVRFMTGLERGFGGDVFP